MPIRSAGRCCPIENDMHKSPFIPFHVPSIGEEEIQEVVATLRSGWLTTGPRTHQFEEDFRQYVGARHALGVNSCTGGLHVAAAALGLGPGDEVITTPLTFCATVNTILHVGATPVLADVKEDGNIDPESVAQRITPRTKAILPVHYAGLPCDMDALWSLARQHNLRVIEDAAHAAGTFYGPDHIGSEKSSQSDAVVFSFYATKNMTTAEGGMVTTNDAALAEKMRRLTLHGISKDAWNRYAEKGKWFYSVEEPGFKYNLSDLQSALGIHQLRKLESFTSARARLAQLYWKFLGDVEEIELSPDTAVGRNAWHLYVLRLNLEMLTIDRDTFIEELKERGVGTSVHFIPIPLHPFYAAWANLPEQQCPKAMGLYQRIISLPLHPALSEQEVERIAGAVKDVVAANRKKVPVAVANPQLLANWR
jgi:dTDP-4-amino-4,6-dideoxygalactose transaminase